MKATEAAQITEESFRVAEEILSEMSAARDAQIAPYVFAYIDQGNNDEDAKIYLVIKTVGRGMARNVRVSFGHELQNGSTCSLTHIKQIISKIPALPMGGEIRHRFNSRLFQCQPRLPKQYSVRISYHGGLCKTEKNVEKTISLDFLQGLRINRIERKTE